MKLSEYYKTLKTSEVKKLESMKFDSPTKDDVHQDAVMSGISVMYSNDEYIADRVMPVVPVQKESDTYYKFTRNWRLPEAKRAPGGEANEVEWNLSTDNYSCVEYALKDFLADRVKNNADKPVNAEIQTTENLTDLVHLIREKRIADIVFAGGNYGSTSALTGSNQWDDYAGSDPIGDVRTAKDTVHAASGKMPNTMIVGYQVHSKLLDHPDILERIKYTQKGKITADLLASLFEVDNYIVGKAIYDSSDSGGSESLGYIWGKYASLIYAEPSPGLRKVSYGYQFQSRGFRTKRWRKEAREGEYFEAGEIRDEKVVASDVGYLYSTVVS
ncbi:MAG: major capsid protein [Patescibacteria group bacterium]|nr:major capsid protein [Patescibacteria group bacterium]